MKLVTRYEDLTVNQYHALELLKSEEFDMDVFKAAKRLSILSDMTLDEVESKPATFIYDALIKCLALTVELTGMPLKESVKLEGKVFKPIVNIHEITTAQHKDFNSILEANGNNYILCLPELLAIIHKEKTVNGFEYVQSNHFENVEIFKRSKLEDTIGAVFFYSKCLKNSSEILTNCLRDSNKIINETMTEISEDKEFQDFLKNGAGNIQ